MEKDFGKYCNNGGCMAKLGPNYLKKVLHMLPAFDDENLIVGFESSDDASVYKISDDIAIIQTIDFFTPMVSDPYVFGQIAATNALSDVYAMGGEVTTAVNVVCYPEKDDPNVLGEILRGGADKVRECGAVLTGGHSINDVDVKYGLSVNGIVHPDKIYKNNNVKINDKIIMTKKLGTSIVLTAKKVDYYDEASYNEAITQMTTLNNKTAKVCRNYEVNAVTDITGFGLLGHLNEMANDCTIEISKSNVNYIDKAYEYAKEFISTSGGQRNISFLEGQVKYEFNDFAMKEVLNDPQTSGGFLISVDEKDATALLDELIKNGVVASIIGEVKPYKDYNIVVKE